MIQASNGKGCEPNELQQTIDDIINNGYSIRVPKTLHKQFIELAQAENISLNQYIQITISYIILKLIHLLYQLFYLYIFSLLQLIHYERRNNSINGNPKYYGVFINEEGETLSGVTATDASCAYGFTKIKILHQHKKS